MGKPKHESILTSELAFLTMTLIMTGEQPSEGPDPPNRTSYGSVEVAPKLMSLDWMLILLLTICVI